MDATKPTDQEIVSELAAYVREVRAAVNALSSGTGFGSTTLNIAAGTTALTIGTDLGRYGLDLVFLTADVAVTIESINGGVSGQIKIFVALDSNVSLVDGLAVNGQLYLNQLPALSSFAMSANDVIALVNVGGDGSTVQGYWKEIFRQTALK